MAERAAVARDWSRTATELAESLRGSWLVITAHSGNELVGAGRLPRPMLAPDTRVAMGGR